MQHIQIDHDRVERIVTITLNKAPFNICDGDFYREITAAFNGVSAIDEDIAVILLKSGCKHFTAGGSLEEIQKYNSKENAARIAGAAIDCMEAIYNCRYPVVTAINGKVLGSGIAIAACSDVVIAEEDATFSLAEINAGFIGASEFLEMILPRRLARYYVYTGYPISAREMKEYGAILDVVPHDQLLSCAIEVAKEIARQSPLALSYFKAAMNHNDNEHLREKYQHEVEYTILYNASGDCKESYRALKERRSPVYKGE